MISCSHAAETISWTAHTSYLICPSEHETTRNDTKRNPTTGSGASLENAHLRHDSPSAALDHLHSWSFGACYLHEKSRRKMDGCVCVDGPTSMRGGGRLIGKLLGWYWLLLIGGGAVLVRVGSSREVKSTQLHSFTLTDWKRRSHFIRLAVSMRRTRRQRCCGGWGVGGDQLVYTTALDFTPIQMPPMSCLLSTVLCLSPLDYI